MMEAMQLHCPESEFRAGLTDAEFWDYVFNGLLPGQEPFDHGPWDDGPTEFEQVNGAPCPICGALGACGYDELGRALIHSLNDEEP